MATGRVPTTANSPLTAKGDLFGYSTAPARLAVGNDGEQIVADSSTSTGLRYQAPVAANPVLNSAFQVVQRGTSFTVNNSQQYVLDRWYAYTFNNATYSQQATGDTTNLPFIQYCMRVQRNSGATSTSTLITHQPMETINSIPFAGKTVTMSFYARKGANFSQASSQLATYLISGTGTNQNYSAGYTGQAFPINGQQATLTTTWQRFSYTGTIAATATELTPYFEYIPTGTAGAADYFEITGVQIEVGSVATPFRTNAATFQGETSACQRYYWRVSAPTGIVGHMYKYLTGDGMGFIEFPVMMRVRPTSMDILNVQFQQTNLTNNAIIGPTLNADYSTNKIGAFTFGQTGLANGTQGYAAIASTGYVGFSAEL